MKLYRFRGETWGGGKGGKSRSASVRTFDISPWPCCFPRLRISQLPEILVFPLEGRPLLRAFTKSWLPVRANVRRVTSPPREPWKSHADSAGNSQLIHPPALRADGPAYRKHGDIDPEIRPSDGFWRPALIYDGIAFGIFLKARIRRPLLSINALLS